ncbi:MAG: ABC transporter ATP-binding protein [Candidatus Limivivens sp.]|nr:ABC transporter ATP-binding protein [Candidatus Limivivens sp.]
MKQNADEKKKEELRVRRSALSIMGSLIGLVKPLLPIMLSAILLGTAGYLCAIFLTILAAQAILHAPQIGGAVMFREEAFLSAIPVKTLFFVMILLAVLRGVLHYAEQYCNHFIAFKLLAIIRNKVFAALRRLSPAKLEGRDKGNLIPIITTDIELLEVFYAHTISPIAIAVLTSLIMTGLIGRYHVLAGVLALTAYLAVGMVIPLWNGKRGGTAGMGFRTEFGELNSFVLDSLRGLDETIQYGQGKKRGEQMNEKGRVLAGLQEHLCRMEGSQRSVTTLTILLSSFGMLALTLMLYTKGELGFDGVLICTVAMMGSLGPVTALSSLSNNLNQTLASGERVLAVLEEEPLVKEIADREGDDYEGFRNFTGADVSQVSFSYGKERVLKDYSLRAEPGTIIGIHGASGSGKSTLLKLLMRFWDAEKGSVSVCGRDVREIPTGRLRDTESFVTQETHLFHDSIAANIAIGKKGASRAEIEEAARKASIHDFIMTLPRGYDTEVEELGDTLSGGERQRIGIARAFLHDAPFLLLDEPTSNLDSLNEGIILKSLQEACRKQTVVLVSHRKSTMNLADVVYEMDTGNM